MKYKEWREVMSGNTYPDDHVVIGIWGIDDIARMANLADNTFDGIDEEELMDMLQDLDTVPTPAIVSLCIDNMRLENELKEQGRKEFKDSEKAELINDMKESAKQICSLMLELMEEVEEEERCCMLSEVKARTRKYIISKINEERAEQPEHHKLHWDTDCKLGLSNPEKDGTVRYLTVLESDGCLNEICLMDIPTYIIKDLVHRLDFSPVIKHPGLIDHFKIKDA